MIHLSGGIREGCTGGFLFLCFVIYMLYRLLPISLFVSNMKDVRIKNGAGADTLPPPYSAFIKSCSVELVCCSALKK